MRIYRAGEPSGFRSHTSPGRIGSDCSSNGNALNWVNFAGRQHGRPRTFLGGTNMDDFLGVLILLLIVFGLITLLGHASWVLLAMLFRTVFGINETMFDEPMPIFRRDRMGLHRIEMERSPAATELEDLDATARQLQSFVIQGILDAPTLKRLLDHIETRRRSLLGKDKPEPIVPTLAPQVELPTVPPWRALERLLEESLLAKDVAYGDRMRIVALFRQVPEDQLAAMPRQAQLQLARVLTRTSFVEEALQAYQRLLRAHPQNPNFADIALEAGRLAAARDAERARWFLERAVAAPLSAEGRREAEALLRGLEGPVEEVPAVIPVLEPVPEEATAAVQLNPELAEKKQLTSPAPVLLEPELPSAAVEIRLPSIVPPPVSLSLDSAPPPRPPRRSLGEMLASFMEERNILWGELVGGLLMVGCSIALVISLWKPLENIPYFPYLILASITSVLFGIGWYTLHHWKLESTSRGLLVIGTLLVPLNFLVMAGLFQRHSGGVLQISMEIASIAIFTGLVSLAAHVLVPDGFRMLTFAVVGISASQLIFSWLMNADATTERFVLLAMMPVVCHAIASYPYLLRTSHEQPLRPRHTHFLFGMLGLSSFALVIALGLLVYLRGEFNQALQRLAVPVALASVPVLVGGLLIHRGLADQAEEAALRATGTAVAAAGTLVMLWAVAMAWPQPVPLILVCLIDFAVLTAIAFRFQIPLAHTAALPCLVVGYLTTYHLLEVNLSTPSSAALWQTALTPSAGGALLVLVLILQLFSEWFVRANQRLHGAYYAVGSGAVTVFSLALVTWDGAWEPGRATLVYGVYGLTALAVNARWRRSVISYLGLVLLLIATFAALGCGTDHFMPIWSTVLALEALVWGLLSTLLGRSESFSPASARTDLTSDVPSDLPSIREVYQRPLSHVSLWVAWLAIGTGIWSGLQNSAALDWIWHAIATAFPMPKVGPSNGPWVVEHVLTGCCLFAMYLLLAKSERRKEVARIAGWMLIGTVVAGAGWMSVCLTLSYLEAVIGLCLAITSYLIASLTIWIDPPLRQVPNAGTEELASPPWYVAFGSVWRETAIAAGIFALAWSGFGPGLLTSNLPSFTLGLLAVTAFRLAWGYQNARWSWLGSLLVLGCIGHVWVCHVTGPSWLLLATSALISHATVAILLGVLVRFYSQYQQDQAEPLNAIYSVPLDRSALVSSILAVPLLLGPIFDIRLFGPIESYAWSLVWLSALWLYLAWTRRSPRLFTASQAALSLAVLYGVTAWLLGQSWVIENNPFGLWHARSLRAYGLGLGSLGFLWVIARLALRSNETAQALFNPPWIPLDRFVLGLLVVGQLLLAVWELGPWIARELTPIGRWASVEMRDVAPVPPNEASVWGLVALLGLVLGAALWEQWRANQIVGLLVLAITVPILYAVNFGAEQASNCALLWGLGCCFLGVSIVYWLRQPISRWTVDLGCRVVPERSLARRIHWGLMAGTVVPILVLSIVIAGLRFFGQSILHPVSHSFFDQMGPFVTHLLPLVLVCLGLVGYALNERTAGYAFVAGLVANATLMGEYAFYQVRHIQSLHDAEFVSILQLGISGSAAWGIVWLLSRRWVAAWRDRPEAPQAQPLMSVQLWMPGVGNFLLLSVAVFILAFSFDASELHWTVATGSLLGWLAFGLTVVATRGRIHPGLVGFAAIALLACSAERWVSGSGYHALMAGWAVYALAWAAADIGGFKPKGMIVAPTAPTWETDPAVNLVKLSGCMVLILAIKAGVWQHDQLWSAGAIALVSMAGALMAVSRRQEGWAFLGGLGLNLAASFLVWHVHWDGSLEHWWAHLIQANVIASSIGALLWLSMRQRIYQRSDSANASGPLLATQVAVCFLGNGLLLGGPLLLLFLIPYFPASLDLLGEVWGWFALILASAATWWYVEQMSPSRRPHILVLIGLELSILLAFSASKWDTGDWLAYHVLTASWCLLGGLLLALGWIAAIPSLTDEERGNRTPVDRFRHWLSNSLPEGSVRRWVVIISALLVGLSIRGVDDPYRPYWSAAATLMASTLMGGLALWTRQPRYVYVSGLLINLVGFLVWLVQGPPTLEGLANLQLLCLAFGSIYWSLVELALRSSPNPTSLRGGTLPFNHLAAVVGTIGLSGLIGLGLVSHLSQENLEVANSLTWTSWTAICLAIFICLWDPTARLTLMELYTVSLLAILLGIQSEQLSPLESCRMAAPLLAFQVLVAALIGWVVPQWHDLGQRIRIPRQTLDASQPWFEPVQTGLTVLVSSLSVWILITFSHIEERLVAPLATLGVMLGTMLLAFSAPSVSVGHRRRRYLTLALGILLVAEIGWAWLAPNDPLHLSVLFMVVLALMTLVYGVALTRWLQSDNSWMPCCRRMGPVLGVLATLLLLIVLGQEALLYDLQLKRTPMAPSAMIVVIVALVGLIGASISFAVVPGSDPFGFSERGRTAYVYGAEVLLALLFVHLRLNVPELFRGFLGPYWTFIVMAIAFLGVGLSEFFDRRGWRVLAGPLQRTGVFLPMLPLLAFWFRPTAGMYEVAVENVRGTEPLLNYLRNLPMEFNKHAALWFLTGAIYTFVAVTKRSYRFALLAALAANLGWWALLYHFRDQGLAFMSHPQLWLIPLAVIILVAEHLNREQLGPERSNALRYLALLIIYVSSSADMFLAGLGNSVLLPVVLAVLSVLGVLGGILLRIRAFLYLGVAFLFLVIVSMIWHAAWDRQQYWIWWTSGIVLGGSILALFAVFEKRRDDMLRLMNELKHWE